MASLTSSHGGYSNDNASEPIGETLQAIMGVLKNHENAIKSLEEWLGKKTPQTSLSTTQASFEAHKMAKQMLQTSIDEAIDNSSQSSKESSDHSGGRSHKAPKHVLQTSEDRLLISQRYNTPRYGQTSTHLSNGLNYSTHRTPKHTSQYTDMHTSKVDERMDDRFGSFIKQNILQGSSHGNEDVIKMENLYKQHEDDDVMSTTTEYRDLPPHNSTLVTSQSVLATSSFDAPNQGVARDMITSTPAKKDSVKRSPYTSQHHVRTSQNNTSDRSFRNQQNGIANQSHDNHGADTSLKNYSVASLNSKMNLLESQMSDWGEVIDELSDRLANQAVMMRKFVSESLSKKVGVVQYTSDLTALEARVKDMMESKTQHLDRKVANIRDDLFNKMDSKIQNDERQFARQDVVFHIKRLLESLSDQCESHAESMDDITKDMDELRDLVTTVTSDVSFYKHQLDAKNSQSQIMLSLSDHISHRQTDWKEAIKEVHTALNKQSEINSSLHHSMASLQKKFLVSGSSQHLPHSPFIARWRWVGTSGVFPKTHCCVCDDPHSTSLSFVSQLHSSDSSLFSWEKNKPYVLVTRPGCYLVMAGAFTRKSGNPPSLQLTIDEEPVLLFNSSGKSPTKHHTTIMTSAPKRPAVKPKPEGVPPWKTGSTLVGMITLPAHCRVGLVTTSTTPGKHGTLSAEGILQLQKLD